MVIELVVPPTSLLIAIEEIYAAIEARENMNGRHEDAANIYEGLIEDINQYDKKMEKKKNKGN